MKIRYIVWLDYVKDKLQRKHHIETEEVIEVLLNKPRFFFKEKGRVENENIYNALGRTSSGRYLVRAEKVFFPPAPWFDSAHHDAYAHRKSP